MLHALIRTLGNLTTEKDEYSENLVDFGLMPELSKILENDYVDSKVKKDTLWTISNILCCRPTVISHFTNNNNMIK